MQLGGGFGSRITFALDELQVNLLRLKNLEAVTASAIVKKTTFLLHLLVIHNKTFLRFQILYRTVKRSQDATS